MKYLIHLAFMLALVGCDQTSDVTSSTDKDTHIASTTGADAGETQSAAEAPAGNATQELKAQVFQFGIYKATKKGRVTDSTKTNTGKVVRKPTLEHVSMTDRIPLVKDTYFGLQYRLWNLPTEVTLKRVMQLRSVLIHPEMTLPDGSRVSRSERKFRKRATHGIVTAIDAYALSEDYELVEGDWVFQLWYQDEMLVEAKFTTYWPQEERVSDQGESVK